ncbi:hypothetical protein BDZ89DRAFT_1075817 [Hymenopellis radicata]|nr:hypothetical protein BDZ89DRAFT_1075817 [Hymenopellis radicata]
MADATNTKHCPNCASILLRPGEEVGGTRTARVKELLRQNHPPLDVELFAFRKIADDARATLDDLDSKIVQARELLENLLSARQQAQSHLEDTKSLLHPMRSIPDELILEIFGHCISRIPNDQDPDALDPKGAPWLLTRVCHRWREVAINSPQLWTHLFLDFDRQMDHITDLQCAYKVGVFTDRSRGLPMTVYLGSEESLKGRPVLPVLEVSIPRWNAFPEITLQTFEKLFLRDNDFPDEWDISLDVFDSTNTPALRNLEVPMDESWLALKHVVLPWSRLTSITSFPAFDADGWNCLRTLVNLEDLQVDVIVSHHHRPIRDIVPLPKLRYLTITEHYNAPGSSKEFFSALAIPALSELTLECHDKSVLHFPASPIPLGNLMKLDITCDMNSHEENTEHLLNFLTLTHHVECLRLKDSGMTVEFADGLNLNKITDGLPARLPCLQFLDIDDCEFAPTANDSDPLFEMLYSRLPAATVEGKQGVEETVNVNTLCNAGMNGNGLSAATNQSGTDFDSRCRLNSEDHRRCLKTVRFPRWLYVQTRRERPETFLELTSRAELECGVATRDDY